MSEEGSYIPGGTMMPFIETGKSWRKLAGFLVGVERARMKPFACLICDSVRYSGGDS